MEKNLNSEISKINMEISKKAAKKMEDWAGLNAPKPSAGASFLNLNGSTAQMIKEQQTPIKPKMGEKIVFSFGLLNTIAALKNSSFNDLPAGKILLEKYDYLLLNKNIPEAFLIEGFIQDLRSFSWENSIAPVLENLNKIYDKNRREIEVIKAYENIKNAPGKELFSDATDAMEDWLISEKRATDSLIYKLKKFGFNPIVRNLINFLSLYENNKGGKFNIGYDNNTCEVSNIYSPIHIDKDGVVFYSSGKFLMVNEDKGILSECPNDKVPEELRNKSNIIDDRDIKIEENKVSLKIGNDKLDIVFENDNKIIYFNGKKINENDIPMAISASTNTLLENANHKISKAIFVSKAAEEILDIDFGKKIKSKIYEGVEANIFKIKDKIYVQTVNPAMRLNKIYEANATQAINIIRDFIKYDISESLTEFLEGENAIISVMKNDKDQIVKNIEILENELRKIENAKVENPLIAESPELLELQESIENEINILKDKWNQINLQLEKFENKPKELSSINEEMGYPINTNVRIKRNKTRGKIIGVNGISKTYTILFKNGDTGEYFFSDVENIDDEVDNYDITAPNIGIKNTATNESKGNNIFAKAPEEETPPSKKFIEDEKNANLAKAPGDHKRGRYERKLMKKYQSFMSEMPSAKKRSKIKDIDIDDDQKNKTFEEAPNETTEGSKKFIENEKNANLADAPRGDNKKKGKKFIEDEKNANLAKAPGIKK